MKARDKFQIVKFINSHKDWRKILSSPPYNLMFRDDGKYVLIKYNQIFSDFKEQMVREARGLILKKVKGKYILVCAPFTKFFCAGDPNAQRDLFKLYHRKEWFVEQKIDGSLIKLWWDNDWHVSTSGTVNAENAELQFVMNGIANYRQLFDKASSGKIDYSKLDKRFTYMFELVGLENKVVVPYSTEDIYYLGKRDNYTLYETPYYEDDLRGVEKCLRPKIKTINITKNPQKVLKDLQEEVNKLTKEDEHFEGCVISDKNLKTRVKMKSSQYMELFFQKGNGIFTPRKILLMILDSKDDDILSSFPEYRPQFDNVREHLISWVNNVRKDLIYMSNNTWETKRDFAEWAKTTTCSSIIFQAYNQEYNIDDWLEKKIKNINIDNLVRYIGVDSNV